MKRKRRLGSKKKKGSSINSQSCVQGLVILCLGLVLGHTLTLLNKGSTLALEQVQEFASHHKSSFLQQAEEDISKRKHGAEFIPSGRAVKDTEVTATGATTTTAAIITNPDQPLHNLKILVAIASFDFSQLPHLEETLDGYHDVCLAGVAKLDIYIHTTVVYPVAWLDMWRTRFNCPQFTLTFVIQNKSVRLHLVDLHRHLFYEELQNYDLFVYTEDDIRVSPTTVAAYWQETQALKARQPQLDYTLFNVGIVRYELNFPSVVIDDKTRHATEKVTRVYWEHSGPLHNNKPILPFAAQGLNHLNTEDTHYVHMKNHHQGMFLATRQHLQRWEELPNCKFDTPTDRPGYGPNGRQPVLGTQRVWMSSYQLYESRYCNVQQVLPVERFGALTVHHIPNKNYRRKKGGKTKLEYGNQTETMANIHQGSPDLITALQVHLVLAAEYPRPPQVPYRGKIKIVDKVNQDRTQILEERLEHWRKYTARGGVLGDEDMQRTDLIEWSERLAYIQKAADRKRRHEENQRKAREQEQEQQQG